MIGICIFLVLSYSFAFDIREVLVKHQDLIFPAFIAAIVMIVVNFGLRRSSPSLAKPIAILFGIFVYFILLTNPQFGKIPIIGNYSLYKAVESFLPYISLFIMLMVIYFMRGKFNWLGKILVGVLLLFVLPFFGPLIQTFLGAYTYWITFLLPLAIIVWGSLDLLSRVREKELEK